MIAITPAPERASTLESLFKPGHYRLFINDEWELEEVLIAFDILEDDEHCGQQAAKAFARSAANCGALDKMSP